MTADHIDRAAEVIRTEVPGLSLLDRLRAARALADSGLLASPERDAAVAAKALPVEGCSCTPHEQDAGGGHTEYLLEYEPACPEHSEHLWDPKQGMWVLRSEHDAAVAAEAWDAGCATGLREANDKARGVQNNPALNPYRREAGESDADT